MNVLKFKTFIKSPIAMVNLSVSQLLNFISYYSYIFCILCMLKTYYYHSSSLSIYISKIFLSIFNSNEAALLQKNFYRTHLHLNYSIISQWTFVFLYILLNYPQQLLH